MSRNFKKSKNIKGKYISSYLTGKLYRKLTGVEIAEKLGVSKNTIYKKLRQAGIRIRDRVEAQRFAYFRGRLKGGSPKLIHFPHSIKEKTEEAYIIGSVMGDGCLYGGNVRLKVTQKEFRDKFARAIKNAYCVVPKFRKEGDAFICDVHRVLVMRRIKELTKNLKEIPTFIINGNQRIKANFIKGFADAEGSMDDSGNKRQIVITQDNTKILEGIQELLLDLGIQSTIYHKTNNSDQLVISLLRNLKKYMHLINFTISYKKRKLANAIKYLKKCTYDTNIYWSCLRRYIDKENSFRSLARDFDISWGIARAWIRGARIPRQIKKDFEYGIVPKDYEGLRKTLSFLPKIKDKRNCSCKEALKNAKV